jgi:murein DD-endopeptidase MepM/ murein hydrolase activator NlpD
MTLLHISDKNERTKRINIFAPVFLSAAAFSCIFTISQTFAETTDTSSAESVSTSTTEQVVEMSPEELAAQAEAEALRDKISQKNSELDTLKKQIDTYEKELNFTRSQSKTLQNTVKSLDLDRQKMSTSIKLTQKQLETSSLNLSQLNSGIADTESKMALVNNSIAEILRNIDRTDSKSIVETVLASGKLSEIMDEGMQLTQLRENVREHMNELKSYQNSLKAQKTKVESEKKKLTSYQATLSDKKSVLDSAKKEKADLLAITKNRESDYQKILNANKKKQEEFEKELFDYEAKLTRQLDKKFIPSAGTKILSWPLDKVIITQHFGKTKDAARLYASGTHNGLDMSANRGTPVKSPARGQVVATGDTDLSCPKASYGKWVLIRHDNGLTTLFGHFDVIKVGSGQNVETGDLIGYSGNTGYSTGPHVHLTVFASNGVQVGSFKSTTCPGKALTMPLPTAKNAYLDPEAYLPDR